MRYTAILSLGFDADDPDAAAQIAQELAPGLTLEALHQGEPDGVNPPLERCTQCDRFLPESEVVAYYDKDHYAICKACAEDG